MPTPLLTRELVLTLALFLMLSACAPKTMHALRQDPSATQHVVVDRPYMEVHRTIGFPVVMEKFWAVRALEH
jgi:hypothetical protein